MAYLDDTSGKWDALLVKLGLEFADFGADVCEGDGVVDGLVWFREAVHGGGGGGGEEGGEEGEKRSVKVYVVDGTRYRLCISIAFRPIQSPCASSPKTANPTDYAQI